MSIFDCFVKKKKPVTEEISAYNFPCGCCKAQKMQINKPQTMKLMKTTCPENWSKEPICDGCIQELMGSGQESIQS